MMENNRSISLSLKAIFFFYIIDRRGGTISIIVISDGHPPNSFIATHFKIKSYTSLNDECIEQSLHNFINVTIAYCTFL